MQHPQVLPNIRQSSTAEGWLTSPWEIDEFSLPLMALLLRARNQDDFSNFDEKIGDTGPKSTRANNDNYLFILEVMIPGIFWR